MRNIPWLNWLLFVITLLLSINVVRSWFNLFQRGGSIKTTQEKYEKVAKEQEDLIRQLARVQSREYVESQARDKLNLGKTGEVVALLPSISPSLEVTPTPFDSPPNWQKWVKIFLY